MKSDRGKPVTAPTFTRIQHEGKPYIATGTWSEREMVEAIEDGKRRKEAGDDGRYQHKPDPDERG